ncbi:hypothetical protein SAMN05892877_1279 [Rhizobium subbaraonis]|uniref:Uncharacterized protein n=2 Tax=Rhizobium subbaraonis TaxID=908946 RepID=A0A285UZ55_9HYPH|nr:hypothetical protein SAMN05892877_1279 [Rhizobium subbaraonis]
MEILASHLVPTRIMFRIKPMQDLGPRSFGGKQQVGVTDAGYWVGSLGQFPIADRDQILDWRGIIASLEGMAGDLMVGPFDDLRAPTFGAFPPVVTGIPHSDGATFSDGSGYSQSTIRITLAGALPRRATSAVLTIHQAGALQRGMYFSVYEGLRPSLHIITKPPEIDGNHATIQFRPPLRFAVESGATVDFATPKALMNLASADEGALDLDMGRWARPSLELVESWSGV